MKQFITLLFLTFLFAHEAQAAWPREPGSTIKPKEGSLISQIEEIKENPTKDLFIFITFSF
jgi:hypothetical protein